MIITLSQECASERILKIGQYLAKIWTKVKWHAFLGPPCSCICSCSCCCFSNFVLLVLLLTYMSVVATTTPTSPSFTVTTTTTTTSTHVSIKLPSESPVEHRVIGRYKQRLENPRQKYPLKEYLQYSNSKE